MKKHLLIIGICIVILLIPISSAVNVNTDVNDEAIENPETEPLDEYTEIFSIIIGKGYGSGNIVGSVNLSRGDIFIIAYTTEGSYTKRTNQIYIEFFIGALTQPSFGGRWIFGVAIGNIDWE
jgi:hypothetical protein